MTQQLTTQRIEKAEQFAAALHGLLKDTPLATDDGNRKRIRAAVKLFGIVQDHHFAIVFLLRHEFYSSIMALLRSVFEAYLRGLWIKHCATDTQVQKFIRGKQPPKNECMIEAIEDLPDFGKDTLSRIKKNAWKEMCDFAHAGGLYLERWESEDGIEANFDPAELENALNYSELLAAMSGLEVVQMNEGSNKVETVLKLIETRWPRSTP